MNYDIVLQIQIFIPLDLRIWRLNSFDPNWSFPESRRKASYPQNRIYLEGMKLNHVTSNDLSDWVRSSEYEIIQYLRQFWEDSTKLLIIGSTISGSWEMQSADWSFDCVVESSDVNWFYTSEQKHVYVLPF